MPALRAHGPAQLTGAAATKYTVPAGMRFILRHIHIENPGAAVTLTASIGVDAAATRIFDAYPIGANTALDFWFYTALAAAEIIQAFANVAAQLVIVIDGDVEAV